MAAEVRPLPQLKLPAAPSPATAEQRYWKTFKNQKSHTTTASWPVTHISFPSPYTASPASSSSATAAKNNDLFAVTAGPRVDVYSIRKREPLKTIGRFDSVARSGEIRSDSRVLVAADDSGKMQVFDVAGGARAATLKTWHVHKQPVWVTRWSPSDPTALMSASDDKTVRLWDLPGHEPTRQFVGHQDYVRSGAFMPGGLGASSNMLVTGSYDATVRIWDARVPTAGGAVLTFKHAAPVEEVLPLPTGTTVLAAADNAISVLDLVAAKPLRVITNHQKTVTALCLASNGTRVVSGALDGHAKVFETGSWNVVAGIKYPSPILSLNVITAGANATDRHLAVGMQSGVLSLKTRLTGSAADRDRDRERAATATDLSQLDYAKASKRKRNEILTRSLAAVDRSVDFQIDGGADGTGRRGKERQWHSDLRHGRYAAALDAVLDAGAPDHGGKLDVLTLLVALRHRSALRAALERRADPDPAAVLPVLHWICTHIIDPRYRAACVDVGLHLLDLYAEHAGHSAALAHGFKTLRKRVAHEVEKAQVAAQTGGMLEALMVAGDV